MRRAAAFLVGILAAATVSAEAQTYYAERSPTGASMQGFGGAVAVGADAVFVGEPQNEATTGMVYVYRRGAAAAGWTEASQLKATDGKPGDHFGSALAVNGTMLLVGATNADSTRGAAYLFQRGTGGRWTQGARLTPTGLAAGDNAGAAVALSGNLAVVAATGRDSLAGAVYVFQRNGSSWSQVAELTGSDVKRGDRFGSSVAVMGDLIFVGAPRHSDQAGIVYVFRRNESGAWTEEAKLSGRGVTRNNWFGASLAVHDDTVMVGAPRFNSFSGGVFAFARDSGNGEWRQAMMLVPFDGGNIQFGASVAWDGPEVWVGAPGAGSFAGRIYQFRRDSTGEWLSATKLGNPEGQRGDFMAGNLAMAGGVAVAGIPGDDYGAGTALIFERNAQGAWRQRNKVMSEEQNFAAVLGHETRCDQGEIAGFDCNAVDLVSFLPVGQLGGKRGVRLNDIWGWTDSTTGREYAIVGRVDGTSFVDVTDPANPRYLGDLPMTPGSHAAVWRDMKVYKNHAYIVADGAGEHGMQVFDLTQLRRVRGAPVTFKEAAHYDRIHSAHNIVINEQTGFAYTVGNSSGGETCGGGLHMINIQDPEHPTFAGCFADKETGRASTGYSHDAQCVTYHGPDTAYQGHEICFGANETALSIADVTDKQNPKALARSGYPNVGYAHQGWLTDDQRYFFMDDELDELAGTAKTTRTLIWDVSDLDDPVLAKEYYGPTGATDHNLYIKGNRLYQSNYVFGLRVVDISNPTEPKELGYFDTVPYGENVAGFGGSWSNYPYFKNGVVAVTSGREGLFLVRPRVAPVP